MTELTRARLIGLLRYDPETGAFTWLVKKGRRGPGDIAGCVGLSGDGLAYRFIKIDQVQYAEHVLAYFYMTGEWPRNEIDHRNLDGTDNRWRNLRPATRSQNGANRRTQSNNKCGIKGIYWNAARKKWQATISYRGRNIYLGRFDSAEAAEAAYVAASQAYYGEFAWRRGERAVT